VSQKKSAVDRKVGRVLDKLMDGVGHYYQEEVSSYDLRKEWEPLIRKQLETIRKLEQARDNLTAYLMGMARKYEEQKRPGTATLIRSDIKEMRKGKPQ